MNSQNDFYETMFRGFPDVVTVPQLSRMLNINEKTAYQLVREQQIHHFKLGRTYRIPKNAVFHFLCTATGVVDSHPCQM